MRTAMLSWTVAKPGLPNVRSFRSGPRQEYRGPWLAPKALAMTAASFIVLGVTLGGQSAQANECNVDVATTIGNTTTDTACGTASVANGGGSTALGNAADAGGVEATALGETANAAGIEATAVGADSSAAGAQSTANAAVATLM